MRRRFLSFCRCSVSGQPMLVSGMGVPSYHGNGLLGAALRKSYSTGKQGEANLVKGATLAPRANISHDKGWDDNSLLEDIARTLFRLSSQSMGLGGPDGRADAGTTVSGAGPYGKFVPIHHLFRELTPSLRHQLSNSSFSVLSKALESRPEWFVISDKGSEVAGTESIYSQISECDAFGLSASSTSARGGAAADRGGCGATGGTAGNSEKKIVIIRGALANTPVDISKPPLSEEEVVEWKLTRLILPLNLPFLLDEEPVTLFPNGEKPRLLSMDLEKTEAIYASKGFFPPSEVAAAFIHITPTFFVETRHVLNAMSPDVARCFESSIPKNMVVDMFFKKYPMIFKIKSGKFQKAAVKLNLDFKFIRDYPGCGSADRFLRRCNQEYRPTVGGMVSRPLPSADGGADGRRSGPHIDVKIFEVLVRNLPRVQATSGLSRDDLEKRRCQPFSLVEWINGFSQEDIDILNTVPQERVLTLLTRYVRIFQLMCRGEDVNLFTEHKVLEQAFCGQHPSMSGALSPQTSQDAQEVDQEVDILDNEEDGEIDGQLESKEGGAVDSETDSRRREAELAAALRDDFIGLDDILSDTSAPKTVGYTEEGSPIDETVRSEESMTTCDGLFTDEGGAVKEGENLEGCGSYGDNGQHSSVKSFDRAVSVMGDDCSAPYIPSRYDIIYLRRLPKRIAPRSLSDYNARNSPEPNLLRHIVSFLTLPPSLQGPLGRNKNDAFGDLVPKFSPGPWRWVTVQRIYASLSRDQKRSLRAYKGLVHFMRLHGELFELSSDFMHIIAHDSSGNIPPFVPTQTVFHNEDRVLLPDTFDDDETSKASLIGDSERNKFISILGASQIPTDRQQLLILDPLNPLLDHEILCEEVSLFMPDHPVSIQQLIARLPPILKAALSARHKNNFKTSKHLNVWMENNRMMLQKSALALPESALEGAETISVEDAIECVREVIPDEGVVIGHLSRMLPSSAKRTLKVHFGGLYSALLGYPQYFYIEKNEADRMASTLFLVERLQEEKR